jgi:2-polyprenyl-3-methyl-5-hydroxy-6-metoxy-1,4-benzoquinol methylase
MKAMKQQEQTKDYFKAHAADWQRKATDETYSNIDNRHRAVIETMRAYPAGSSLLDVGCGAGQLTIEAAQLGWRATGLDFAQEMIDHCAVNAKKAGVKPEFVCGSVFDYDAPPGSFDVISAQGFIEYISLDQLDEFLGICVKSLKPGAAVAIGSRNRLFNLHSLNAFTDLEMALGTVDRLLLEAQALQGAKDQAEAVAKLAKLGFEYEQPTAHPRTGVAVETRYQFTPADLIAKFARHGLHATRIFPVHYHPLPISLLAEPEFKSLHRQLARLASDQWITRVNLVPYSSSFVLEAKKG